MKNRSGDLINSFVLCEKATCLQAFAIPIDTFSLSNETIPRYRYSTIKMLSRYLFTLTALALGGFSSPVEIDAKSGVQYEAYLGNACNGENLYGGYLTKGKCVDVSQYEEASSLTVSGFKKGQTVHFYYNDNCSDQVGTANSEECYIVDSDIKSIKLTG
ncbi:hypothetical protein PRZ48_002276 [Zasmidium cellare]|uniref:Uncharacterized protein n=1 Tax=Zasmidium cellare TaxID=395010 RepID=A0ABR0F4A8_ZASCE|nr:hypothetical protein PRZ48_002276 [Zasmidium cellare]